MLLINVDKALSAPTLNYYASTLAGRNIGVVCQPMKDAYGFTLQEEYGDGTVNMEPIIYLSPGTCDALRRLSKGDLRDTYDEANAVLTLKHEATHIVLNSVNEATVECNAILNINGALKLFNLSKSNIRKFHMYAWADHWNMLSDYTNDPVCMKHAHVLYMSIGPVKERKHGN